MKYLIASFHNGNLDPELLAAQRQVFEHYGIPLVQWESKLPHGEAMDECARSHDWDVAALFDADAFCRDAKWLFKVMADMLDNPDGAQFIGGAHNANHRADGLDYASPACCIITHREYQAAALDGCDGFKMQQAGPGLHAYDVCECLSKNIQQRNPSNLALIYPKAVKTPKWRLRSGGQPFGYGTDYGVFFHEFESRIGESAKFRFVAQVEKELQKPHQELNYFEVVPAQNLA